MTTKPAIAIIQARMSSSRLPGKVMKPLAGRPMIWHIVQRANACQQVDQVVVATSAEPSDDPLADFCVKAGISCHRGSLNNVLGRYLAVLNEHPYPYFVRITGDCPLIDPDFIDRQVEALAAHDGDVIWLSRVAPLLAGAGVFSTSSVRYIAAHSDHHDDLEHVGFRYLVEHPDDFRIIGMRPPPELSQSDWRVTVDEQSDYEVMSQLYEALWATGLITLDSARAWLTNNLALSRMNQQVVDSAINQELHAKQRALEKHISLFCDWANPTKVVL